MYTLYGGRFTRAIIVQMVMDEGNLQYDLKEIEIVENQHRSEAFLKINPAGMVPALITPGGEMLHETPAICLYLAEHHQLTDLAPDVRDPMRGQFLSGLFFITDELEPAMKRYFYPHRHIVREQDTKQVKKQSLETALERLSVIEARLSANGPYYLGERFSLIDIVLAYWSSYVDISEQGENNMPGIRRARQLVINRPKLKTHFDNMNDMRIEYKKLLKRGKGVK